MMKWLGRIFDAALLVCLTSLCSCNTVEEFDNNGLSEVLSFTPHYHKYDIGATTKSSNGHFLGMMGSDSLFISVIEQENALDLTKSIYGNSSELDKFYVSALLDDGATKYMDKVEYTPNNSNGWESSPEYYWPKETALNFFAYALSADMADFTPVNTMSSGKYTSGYNYVLPPSGNSLSDAIAQPDITIAITPEQSMGDEAVGLEFFHTLSAVRFRIGEMPEDVDVNGAVITLSNVKSNGKCTVTSPVSESSIVWADLDGTPETGSFSQVYGEPDNEGILGGSDETFSMIPQLFGSENTAKIEISLLIGDTYYNGFEFDLKDFGSTGSPHKWEHGKRYTYKISKSEGDLDIDIAERVTSTVKEDVFIQNTGWVTGKIRAAVVGYWSITGSDGIEEIVAPWDINDSTTGTLTKDSDWGNYWELGTDGFYYYKEPLLPGQFTEVALFDKYELKKTTGPVTGSKLTITIAAQAIEKDKADANWTNY